MANFHDFPKNWEQSTDLDSRLLMSGAMLEAMYRDRSFTMVRTITGHALRPPIKMKWPPAVRLVVDNGHAVLRGAAGTLTLFDGDQP